MGIKKLNELIRKYAPGCLTTKHIGAYKNKKIALDLSIYIFKYKAIFGDKWIVSFIQLMLLFVKHDICCVIVFDNPKKNVAKAKEHEKRASARKTLVSKTKQLEEDIKNYKQDQTNISESLYEISKKQSLQNFSEKTQQFLSFKGNVEKKSEKTDVDEKDSGEKPFSIELCEMYFEKLKKQNIKIDQKDIEIVKSLIPILGMNFITSHTEAEGTCAFLCYEKIVDAVLSEDTDVLAYGCKTFLSKINIGNETIMETNYELLLQCLKLNESEFLDLCVLLGTDFNCNLKGIGFERAYRLILKHRNIETILKETEHTKESISKLSFVETRNIFCMSNVNVGFVEKNISSNKLDNEKWKEFLFTNNLTNVFGQIKFS